MLDELQYCHDHGHHYNWELAKCSECRGRGCYHCGDGTIKECNLCEGRLRTIFKITAAKKAPEARSEEEAKKHKQDTKKQMRLRHVWLGLDPEGQKLKKELQERRAISNSAKRIERVKRNGGSYNENDWQDLCGYYGNACLACGATKTLAADHIVPVVKGGSSDISNIQPLCKSCNSKKGTQIIDYRETVPPWV